MRQYKLTSLFVLFVAFISCNESPTSPDTPATDTVNKEPTTNTTTNNLPVPDTSFNFLKGYAGKYPAEVKLLNKPLLNARLKNLLGDRYAFFQETWAVEQPIEINNNSVIVKACEAHNCDNTNFILVIDVVKNSISVGIREEKNVKVYSENQNYTNPELDKWVTPGL